MNIWWGECLKYTLEVSEKQAEIIKKALEEYFRLRMNQCWDFATEVAGSGYEYNKEDSENSEKFNAYIERRNKSEKMFQDAMREAQSGDRRLYIPQTEEMLRAQDIWQVIRYRLYLDRGGSINDMVVDARTPMSRTGEELPIMEKKE